MIYTTELLRYARSKTAINLFWVNTDIFSAVFALHVHELSLELKEGVSEGNSRSTIALQSLVRVIVHSTKASASRTSLQFDAMAFWTHSLPAKAALEHIKHSPRDEQWESDLHILKTYLQFFAPRYKIYGKCLLQTGRQRLIASLHIENYLKEIEAAQKNFIRTEHSP